MVDTMINRAPTVQTQNTLTSPLPQAQKGPGRFGRIFGGLLGGALNLVAPGAGSLIGGLIGRGSGGGSGMDMQGMLDQSAQQQMQMIAVQQKVQNQTQEFTTVSNLLKARHDGEMSAVHNFKS